MEMKMKMGKDSKKGFKVSPACQFVLSLVVRWKTMITEISPFKINIRIILSIKDNTEYQTNKYLSDDDDSTPPLPWPAILCLSE